MMRIESRLNHDTSASRQPHLIRSAVRCMAGHSVSARGDVIVLYNTSRPQRLVELSNETHIASRTLAESSQSSQQVLIELVSSRRWPFRNQQFSFLFASVVLHSHSSSFAPRQTA
jgi:ribosomal protein L16 Arg81 hydroxylase